MDRRSPTTGGSVDPTGLRLPASVPIVAWASIVAGAAIVAAVAAIVRTTVVVGRIGTAVVRGRCVDGRTGEDRESGQSEEQRHPCRGWRRDRERHEGGRGKAEGCLLHRQSPYSLVQQTAPRVVPRRAKRQPRHLAQPVQLGHAIEGLPLGADLLVRPADPTIVAVLAGPGVRSGWQEGLTQGAVHGREDCSDRLTVTRR